MWKERAKEKTDKLERERGLERKSSEREQLEFVRKREKWSNDT